VVGVGGRDAADWLRLDDRLTVLDSPRSANVLLLVGRLTERLFPSALAVHDAMSEPRAVVQWLPERGGEDPLAHVFPELLSVGPAEPLGEVLVFRQAELLRGVLRSSPSLLPDEDPAPWRGIGPYKQGGKGMSGGVPYGRPLPGRAPDRDGVELDQLTVRMGPALPLLPPGLVLEVKLQGDVIQEASILDNAFDDRAVLERVPRPGGPFRRALIEPVGIQELELARARHHLRWLAHALRLHGLDALGIRVIRMARDLTPSDGERLRSFRKLLTRIRTLDAATAGIGIVRGESAEVAGGPPARAAGHPADARIGDESYGEIGFEPVLQRDGDARARWRQRMEEAIQALDLAKRAGDRRARPTGEVESPRGSLTLERAPSARLLSLLPGALAGQEWGDAVTTVVSLDLDMEEAARQAEPVSAGTGAER
jgi:hypothetical protein